MLFAAGGILAATSAASAAPGIQLLQDSSDVSAQAWFDRAGDMPRSQAQHGPGRAGLLAQAPGLLLNGPHERSEVTARSRTLPLDGLLSLGAYASVEPAGLRQPCRGQAATSFTWRLQVGDSAVDYAVNLWASRGGSSFYLYDETAGTVLADTGTYQGLGTSLAGQLQAGHTYTVRAWAQADASRGGDPSAGAEFRTLPISP